jgi:hypothetical protein
MCVLTPVLKTDSRITYSFTNTHKLPFAITKATAAAAGVLIYLQCLTQAWWKLQP